MKIFIQRACCSTTCKVDGVDLEKLDAHDVLRRMISVVDPVEVIHVLAEHFGFIDCDKEPCETCGHQYTTVSYENSAE
jgi:hypothetical protein